MAYALWRETRMSVAGIVIPCMSLGMSMTTNPKEIKIADGTKTGNSLKGYSRGRAQSQFTCRANLFSAVSGHWLNAILSTTPFAIAAQYGDAGGESAEGYTLTDLEVAWSNGGDPEATATFRTSNTPVPGATVGAPSGYGDIFTEQDVTVVTLPGGNHTVLHRFSFRITRTLAEDYGNQPQGLPFSIDQSSTAVRLTCEYRKEDDSEESAFAGTNGCPTHAPCGIILTQVCPTGGNPGTLALDIPDGFHENYPDAAGGNNIDAVVYKNASILSASGSFSIAGS